MYINHKKIYIVVVLIIMILVKQVTADTTVCGFHLGKSTYDNVKYNLQKHNKIQKDNDISECGGRSIFTNGEGYGIEGLKKVHYCFDKKQIFVKVSSNIEVRRFKDVKNILTSKYQLIPSKYSETFLMFKANQDYIYLYLPRDKENGFSVTYMTGSVFRQMKELERKTEIHKKALERKNQEELEQEAAAERDKF
jgi:hypothetical protein